MKTSRFATKILKLKLTKFQKDVLDDKASKKLLIANARRPGDRLTELVLIKTFHKMYKKKTK